MLADNCIGTLTLMYSIANAVVPSKSPVVYYDVYIYGSLGVGLTLTKTVRVDAYNVSHDFVFF